VIGGERRLPASARGRRIAVSLVMFVGIGILLGAQPARAQSREDIEKAEAAGAPRSTQGHADDASTAAKPAGSDEKGTTGQSPTGGQAPSVPKPTGMWSLPHYDKGFVLVSSPDEAPMPFQLKLNHVSQFRYTNTLAVEKTYTDHYGNEIPVQRRNDVQLVRDAFYFNGYAFDRRLDYNILIFTSSATLVATAAGYVGFVFNKAFALRAGYFSLPSVRSLTGTYPFFHANDRSMANNYMRPGFTQGVWANGEIFPGFNYIGMVGNSLNTLDIKAANIDNHLAYSLSVWYDWNDFRKEWNDYEYHQDVALRIGSAFTFSREDRLSNLETATPENNVTYISDGHLLFETGALAPNVTLQLASYYLSAVDVGIKFRGLAFNAELYNRWLNKFVADGPLPVQSLYDWGFEASLGYFVLRQRLEPFVRSSYIHGLYKTAVEGSVGFNWYPFATRWVWLTLEAIGVVNNPYASGYYVYSVGQTGLLIPLQFLLRF
jgi:hypothetical protein